MTKLTTKIIAATTAVLIVYDLHAAHTPEEGDTISEVIADAARRRPIIAVAAGVLVGHWFWALREKAPADRRRQ
jgi:hypothetical protein